MMLARAIGFVFLAGYLWSPVVADQTPKDISPTVIQVEVKPHKPRVGDVVTIVIKALSQPDVDVEMPSLGEAIGEFRVLRRQTSTERLDDDTLITALTFDLETNSPGDFELPTLELSFVDYRKSRSAEHNPARGVIPIQHIQFHVDSVLPQNGLKEIHPLSQDLPELPQPSSRKTPLLVFLICLGAFLCFLVVWTRGRPRSSADALPPVAIALRRLRELESQLTSGASGELGASALARLDRLLRELLQSEFAVSALVLTPCELGQPPTGAPLGTPQIPTEFSTLLAEIEVLRFGPSEVSRDNIVQLLHRAERTLDAINKQPHESSRSAHDLIAHQVSPTTPRTMS